MSWNSFWRGAGMCFYRVALLAIIAIIGFTAIDKGMKVVEDKSGDLDKRFHAQAERDNALMKKLHELTLAMKERDEREASHDAHEGLQLQGLRRQSNEDGNPDASAEEPETEISQVSPDVFTDATIEAEPAPTIVKTERGWRVPGYQGELGDNHVAVRAWRDALAHGGDPEELTRLYIAKGMSGNAVEELKVQIRSAEWRAYYRQLFGYETHLSVKENDSFRDAENDRYNTRIAPDVRVHGRRQ